MLSHEWFASLRDRRVRDRDRLFLAEGLRFLHSAVDNGSEIVALALCPALFPSRSAERFVCSLEVPKRFFSVDRFCSLAVGLEPQGVLVAARQRWQPLVSVEGDLHLVLDGVRTPGNLGTILRTCEAIGVDSVWLVGGEVDVYDPGCVRASMGAIFSQRLVRTSPKAIAGWKRRRACRFIGASLAASVDYREMDASGPVAVVMGSERKGMRLTVEALCDQTIRIPMPGPTDSLNLAVATSLTLYEVWRKRNPLKLAN